MHAVAGSGISLRLYFLLAYRLDGLRGLGNHVGCSSRGIILKYPQILSCCETGSCVAGIIKGWILCTGLMGGCMASPGSMTLCTASSYGHPSVVASRSACTGFTRFYPFIITCASNSKKPMSSFSGWHGSISGQDCLLVDNFSQGYPRGCQVVGEIFQELLVFFIHLNELAIVEIVKDSLPGIILPGIF